MRISEALILTDTARVTDSTEIVVLHTGPELTPRALQAAANLTNGLNFHLVLIAVHIVPFPVQLAALGTMEEHLQAELSKAAGRSELPVSARSAFARDLCEAFRQCVPPESLVVIASRKRWWRTRPERWASELARNGFRTALVQS
jgi:hypothetical protein